MSYALPSVTKVTKPGSGPPLDAKTKLIAAAHLGPRTQASAHALVHSLTHALAPGCIPAFTSDGLNLYFYALTAHFGTWVDTLQSKKQEWQVAASLLYGQTHQILSAP